MERAYRFILIGVLAVTSVLQAQAQDERDSRSGRSNGASRDGNAPQSRRESNEGSRYSRSNEAQRPQAVQQYQQQEPQRSSPQQGSSYSRGGSPAYGGQYDDRNDRSRGYTDRRYAPQPGRDNRPDRIVYTDRDRDNGRGWGHGNDNRYKPHGNPHDWNRGYNRERGYERRFEGRYEGRWNSSYEVSVRRYGYGRPRYVYYGDQRIYRTPCYIGVIRVRPPYYRGMPSIVYPAYRVNSAVSIYRPIWAPQYSFVRRFVFFPRLNIYWDNYSSVFVFQSGNLWISSTRLPGLYAGVNISTEPMFEVEQDYDSSNDGFGDDGYYYYED